MTPKRMPLRADEELGKKDDDHRIPNVTHFGALATSKVPRPRRLLVVLLTLFLLYEFFKHMPTDLTPAMERNHPKMAKHPTPNYPPGSVQSPIAPAVHRPPKSDLGLQVPREKASYDGKIHFYELARSLPGKPHPATSASEAVIFAAASLHSLSDMLPLACKMGSVWLNRVHFVVMGREEVSIEGIKHVNGISDADCPVTWHDSRPDRALESTQARLERSVTGGLEIIQSFIASEVIITQSQAWEESFFWNGIEKHKKELAVIHIALPAPSINLMWMAHIDSTALKVWNEINVNMVVHASESSSSLIRLIRSLDAADYLGSKPSLTIELPPLADADLLGSLQRLNGLSQLNGRISLRRRVQSRYFGFVESSLRTVESFYPLDSKVSHLLMLSPQTELAPSFYHYLIYSILFYKQSARAEKEGSKLLGVSLELPCIKPTTNSEIFTPPLPPSSDQADGGPKQRIPTFLWQVPNSNAALYFGDKWAEFHSFLSHRLAVSEAVAETPSQDEPISTKYPAFMGYLLEMMRARGYYMIYPSFPGRGAAPLATQHTDLYHPPEEFAHEASTIPPGGAQALSTEVPVDRAHTIMPLLDTYEQGHSLLGWLPLLSYDAEPLTEHVLHEMTADYAKKFRARYGNCSADSDFAEGLSAELFCLGSTEMVGG